MLRSITSGALHLGFLVLSSLAPGFAEDTDTTQSRACVLEPIRDVIGRSALDARTFMTEDHREVRLAGLEVPPPDSVAGVNGKAALEALVAGKSLQLKRFGAGEDRYGRIVAYVFHDDTSLTLATLEAGHAWAAARIGARPCADKLIAAETVARKASRGLWADPELRPKSAANAEEIARNKGRFLLVEGLVLSVRESGAVTYINFGRRYTRDFSVSIARRDLRLFTAAGLATAELQGRRVRVRGVVDMRNGPIIEATRPEQIELIQ